MARKRRLHGSDVKAKVALAAIRGVKTTSELAAQYKVHPALIANWKRHLVANAEELFARSGSSRKEDSAKREAELYQQIGKLQMELEWLKKKVALFG